MLRVRRSDLLALGALVLLATVVAVQGWRSPTYWTPDGFFYRSHVLRLQGVSKQDALERVFRGSLTASARAREVAVFPDKPYARKVANPDWVTYSARFYERRWLVPSFAVVLDPWLGVRGLRAAALAGYVLLAPLLYLLLRLVAPLALALPAAAISLLLAPLRFWASAPQTDSWGVTLETAAIAVGVLVLLRGARWLPLWGLTIVMLAFTRDAAPIAIAAALGALAVRRDRTTLALALVGVAAEAPAPLLGGAPLKEAMAYTLNGYYEAPDATWGFVAAHYLDGVKALVKADLGYLGDHVVSAAVFVGGLLSLGLLRTRADIRAFVWAGAVASLLFLFVLPNYTEFRLELLTVPFVGLGLVALGTRLRTIPNGPRP